MNATSVDEEFNPSVHVYEPHKVGLPALRPYFKALWQRREFAAEMSRTNIRGAHTNTFFGQVWLVLNPLLLALVYYLLTDIIAGGGARIDAGLRFAHMCGGLFAAPTYLLRLSFSPTEEDWRAGGKISLGRFRDAVLRPIRLARKYSRSGKD